MNETRYPDPLEALMVVLSAFALIILIGLMYNIAANWGFDLDKIDKNMQIFFIFGGSLFLIVPLMYARYRKYKIKPLFRFNAVSLSIVIQSILIALTLTILSDELDRIINIFYPLPNWFNEQMEPLKAANSFELILIILGAVFVAAIAEEGLFRGFLQYSLEKHGDVTRAVILSSLSWTMIHMNLYWAIQLFLMGIVIGYMAWRTNSIIPAVIIHGVNNLVGVIFLNFKMDSYMQWYEWNDHVS
ncbi:MAG TPA: CPBP family intramembrane metalloprotease, partial [Caldithrix sp.]|nr:CPBP family intramembrane metalloprotease [Caldithrix sp.]